MQYTDIIREILDQQYPSTEDTRTIVISTIQLRLLPAPAKPLFLRYEALENLVISKCDLRTLENFPKLTSLKALDLSNNSLQGSLNHLMPLVDLTYLNLANNILKDFRKLQPLQMIDNLEVYLVGNPFLEVDSWKGKVKNYGLKVLKEARVFPVLEKKVQKEEKKSSKKEEQKLPNYDSSDSAQLVGNGEAEVKRRNSFLYEIQARRKKIEEQIKEQERQARRNLRESDNSEMNSSFIHIVESRQDIIKQNIGEASNQVLQLDDYGNDWPEDDNENISESDESLNEIEPLLDEYINEDAPEDEQPEEQSQSG